MSKTILNPGQRVKDFEIKRRIGTGGMADLFLARDLVLRRQVVIKVLNPRFCNEGDFITDFLKEARIQANLENPHIVQILSIFTYQDLPCLVMQHIEGTDLDKVIKKAKLLKAKKGEGGALSLERSVHIFQQILEGIGFVHKYRTIHGDIKPANILMNEEGRVKVADFGLSFLLSSSGNREGETLGGTPHYMSPEQILNEEMDIRSDIYSLGVTLYYMLTGSFPLGEIKKTTELIEAHLEGSLERPKRVLEGFPDISPGVKSAIMKALEKDPNNRHQSCLEFALSIKEDRPYEMYSELLRLSLSTKENISSIERTYLEKIFRRRGLDPEGAKAMEENIRREMGLPPYKR